MFTPAFGANFSAPNQSVHMAEKTNTFKKSFLKPKTSFWDVFHIFSGSFSGTFWTHCLPGRRANLNFDNDVHVED